MITVKKPAGKDFLEVKYEGKITNEDYKKRLIPALEKEIKAKTPLSIICDLSKMDSFEGKAIWDDYKFGMDHIKDFGHVATVGDQWWMVPVVKASGLFFPKMKIKHFKSGQYKEALKWVQEK